MIKITNGTTNKEVTKGAYENFYKPLGYTIVVDNDKKQTSRGIYVCYSTSCVEKLKKNNAIQRFLKVEQSSQLYDELKSIIEEKNFD